MLKAFVQPNGACVTEISFADDSISFKILKPVLVCLRGHRS
jgi:hypothetical protein